MPTLFNVLLVKLLIVHTLGHLFWQRIHSYKLDVFPGHSGVLQVHHIFKVLFLLWFLQFFIVFNKEATSILGLASLENAVDVFKLIRVLLYSRTPQIFVCFRLMQSTNWLLPRLRFVIWFFECFRMLDMALVSAVKVFGSFSVSFLDCFWPLDWGIDIGLHHRCKFINFLLDFRRSNISLWRHFTFLAVLTQCVQKFLNLFLLKFFIHIETENKNKIII
jgi:hypothetical protein